MLLTTLCFRDPLSDSTPPIDDTVENGTSELFAFVEHELEQGSMEQDLTEQGSTEQDEAHM